MVGWLRRKKARDEQPAPKPEPEERLVSIHFTEAAHRKLLELLEARGASERGALRIMVKNPGLGRPDYGMALEEQGEPRPDDTLILVDGLRVLIDERSIPEVNEALVDFVDDPLRPGFTVEAPSQYAPPTPPPLAPPPDLELDLSDPLAAAVQHVIDHQVNPAIAAHGGQVTLVAVRDATAYVQLSGGCQGCAMAAVTLKQGVEQLIRHLVPQIREVVDVTDHSSGSNPYFTAAKSGAQSPLAEAAGPYYQASKG